MNKILNAIQSLELAVKDVKDVGHKKLGAVFARILCKFIKVFFLRPDN